MKNERWNTIVNICSQMSAEEDSAEEMLKFLKQHGLSKIDSMKVLIDVLGISLSEAKSIVHLSQAWIDTFEQDNGFHEQLQETAENWSDNKQ